MAKTTRARRDFEDLKRRRFRAAKLFAQGLTQAEVARRLHVSRTSVMRWYRVWRRQGESALVGAGRAGRRPRLSAAQLTKISHELQRGPKAHGHATELWTLPRIAAVIEKVAGVRYHAGHVWRVMRSIGWSVQKPTLQARERDEAAIQAWAEDWPRVKKTPRANGPRSSSSTKADSPSVPRSGERGPRVGKPPS